MRDDLIVNQILICYHAAVAFAAIDSHGLLNLNKGI